MEERSETDVSAGIGDSADVDRVTTSWMKTQNDIIAIEVLRNVVDEVIPAARFDVNDKVMWHARSSLGSVHRWVIVP